MKKIWIAICIILSSLAGLVIWQHFEFNDGKLHVIFCDVGQGDAILIKTPNNKYILYDGGPDRKVLHCLGEYLPFWQRQIDLMLLSHPHADHFFGMFFVLERFIVKAYATEDLINKTQASEELVGSLQKAHVTQTHLQAGNEWKMGGVSFHIVGPTNSYLHQTSPGGTIGESKEFASLVMQITYGPCSILLTGDSQADGLRDAEGQMDGKVTLLQVPHHGSESGLDAQVLSSLQPDFAVISVGADNHYKHPNPITLDLLKRAGIKFKRTDKDGDVEVVCDGRRWKVE